MPVNRRCGDYAFNTCDDRMAILKNETVPRRLGDDDTIDEIKWSRYVAENGYIFLDNDGQDAKVKLDDIMYAEQVQSDWQEENEEDPAFIKNKPNLDAMSQTLKEDFLTEVSYGSLRANTILEKGTSALEILLRMLKASSEIEVRWGVWASMIPDPQIYFGEPGKDYQSKFVERDELLTRGLELKFDMGNTSESNGGYFWIAIPKNSQLRCRKLFQGGHAITKSEGLVETAPGGLSKEESYWLMYRLEFPTISVDDSAYHVVYKFGEVNIDGSM